MLSFITRNQTTIICYSLLGIVMIIFVLWLFSRFFITYTHEFTSWRFFLHSSCDGAFFDISKEKNSSVFLRFNFVDEYIDGEVRSIFCYKEYDFFSAAFRWYSPQEYIYGQSSSGTFPAWKVYYERERGAACFYVNGICDKNHK